MIFLLSKFLIFLLKPLFWIFCIVSLAVFIRNVKVKKRLMIVGLSMLLFFSNDFIVGKIFNGYESNYPKEENYDVGIVLGGFSSTNEINNKIAFNWASDRLFQAISLYKTGRINAILITGNSTYLNHSSKESDLVYSYLRQISIPDSAIFIENKSKNTIENATFSRRIINENIPNAKVLVITSAWHIPRAKVIFSQYFTKEIGYYPTNYIGKRSYNIWDIIIPSAAALSNWELILKEWVGFVVDKYRA